MTWTSSVAALAACDPEDMSSRTGPQSQPTAARPSDLEASPDDDPAAGPEGPGDLSLPPHETLACGDTFEVDPRRSLVITDQALLSGFTFTRVMDQIVATANEPGLTREALYGRWWDFFNDSPGAFPEARHCDDLQINGKSSIGAFPIQCPRPEGVLAFTDPFDSPQQNQDAYIPIGLFNRLDAAPIDGRHCGEYRIVFAKRSGLNDTLNRNLIIFEAMLPNPLPDCAIEGCKKVAELWFEIGEMNQPSEIRKKLEDFYFGDPVGAGPVVHADNYGPRGAGQIRTNGFMPDPLLWQLHEFKFSHECGFGPCIRPTTLKDNPHPELFQDPTPGPGGEAFHKWFVQQVENLEVADTNRFFIHDAGTYNGGQSTSEGNFDNYRMQSGFGTPFRDAIQAAITVPGVTVDQILNRMTTLSCSGCHEHANFLDTADLGDGLPWAPSMGFTHISEEFTEAGPFGPRFPISDNIASIAIPHRKKVMEDFLKNSACSACSEQSIKADGPKKTPLKFFPPGPKAPGLTLGGPPRSH